MYTSTVQEPVVAGGGGVASRIVAVDDVGEPGLAPETETIRIVLAVMVVPHRPAVLAAKMLASLDVLSGGRLTIGVGAGWLQPELEARH
jgi:hypothetical protein